MKNEKMPAVFGRLRKLLFWTHLVAGMTGALFIFCLAATGICIAYETEVIALLEKLHEVTPPADAAPLDLEMLLRRVQSARPRASFSDLTVAADPGAPVALSSGKGAALFLDPYTGEVVGESSGIAEGFFKAMTNFHRSLALPGGARPVGQAITGAACLLCLSLVLTGLYIWIPRRWSPRAVKAAALFNRRLKGKARDWNWHNATGLWLAPLLLVMTSTGLVLGYGWANDAVFALAGSPPERHEEKKEGGERAGQRGGPGATGGGGHAPGREHSVVLSALPVEGLNDLLARAKAVSPGWRTIGVRLSERGPLQFRIEDPSGPTHADTRVTLDRTSGAVISRRVFADQSRGARWVAWIRDIHTGQAGGWAGATLAVLTAGGLLLLVWTGFSLTLRRIVRWRKDSGRTPALS